MSEPLVVADARGLAVPRGGFHIDPWQAVDLAIVTHAHTDHARRGSARYIAAPTSLPFLHARLGADAKIVTLPFGQRLRLGDATISLHPAGHIRGSAQVRIEVDGEVWVVTGDYKRDPDPSSEAFELVPCDTLITEATFALPIYRWPEPGAVMAEILAWWEQCAFERRTAILCCYALGKAQRILAGLSSLTDRPAHLHGAMLRFVDDYRAAGVAMLPTQHASTLSDRGEGALILAPPSAASSPWARRFADPEIAFASGWMRVRGVRRRRGVDRGFVLSDHADWPALLATIKECGAQRVLTTHGYGEAIARALRAGGMEADVLRTEYGDEEGGADQESGKEGDDTEPVSA